MDFVRLLRFIGLISWCAFDLVGLLLSLRVLYVCSCLMCLLISVGVIVGVCIVLFVLI